RPGRTTRAASDEHGPSDDGRSQQEEANTRSANLRHARTIHDSRLRARISRAVRKILVTPGCLVSSWGPERTKNRRTTMRIFVAGAAGAIGQRLVPGLVARGHRVTAATRSPDKVGLLRDMEAEPVVVDGLDAASVGQAVARAEPEAIVHQMTSLAGG